jgi:hypothetical protein
MNLQVKTSAKDAKPYTFMSRDLSPLSSVSSQMDGRTPSPPPKTATVSPRLTPYNPTGSTGIKKRKAKRKVVEPPAKRARKKASGKGVSLPGNTKWPKKSRGDEVFCKTVKLF